MSRHKRRALVAAAAPPAWWHRAAVAALMALTIAGHALYASIEQSPPREDAPMHLLEALAFRDALAAGEVLETPYPPLIYGITALAWSLFGVSESAALAGHWLSSALLIGAMAWLGRSLSGPWGGLWCAVAAAGAPHAATLSRIYLLDLPSTATVALAFAALVASDGLRRRGPALVLGLACALGMLTRWTFAIFMAAPLLLAALHVGRAAPAWTGALLGALGATGAALYYAASVPGGLAWLGVGLCGGAWLIAGALSWRGEARQRTRREGRLRAANLTLAGAIAVLGSGWWYAWAGSAVLTKGANQRIDLNGAGALAEVLATQAVSLAMGGWMLPILALVGAAWSRWSTRRGPAVMALAGAASSWLLLSWAAPASPRYVLPALPFTLALGFGWMGWAPRLRWLLPVGGLVATWQAVGWIDGLRPASTPSAPAGLEPEEPNLYRPWLVPISPPPHPRPYPVAETLQAAIDAGHGQVTVVQLPQARLADRAFSWAAARDGLPIQVDRPLREQDPGGMQPGAAIVILQSPMPGRLEAILPWVEGRERLECWRVFTELGRWQAERTEWCLYGP